MSGLRQATEAGLISAAIVGAVLTVAAGPASATVWTDWTTATAGEPGSAAGTLGAVSVSYSGEVLGNTVINGSSLDWSEPASSFIGGAVTTSPEFDWRHNHIERNVHGDQYPDLFHAAGESGFCHLEPGATGSPGAVCIQPNPDL